MCQDAVGNEFLIPIGYTNMVHKSESGEQTIMKNDFRYDDLIKLLEIIKNINVK